jgi:hypothetical protein
MRQGNSVPTGVRVYIYMVKEILQVNIQIVIKSGMELETIHLWPRPSRPTDLPMGGNGSGSQLPACEW